MGIISPRYNQILVMKRFNEIDTAGGKGNPPVCSTWNPYLPIFTLTFPHSFIPIYKFIYIIIFQPARHSKLEKADILEMTVKHLQSVQRQQLAAAVSTDPTVVTRFRNGFDECAAEVSRYDNTSRFKAQLTNEFQVYIKT